MEMSIIVLLFSIDDTCNASRLPHGSHTMLRTISDPKLTQDTGITHEQLIKYLKSKVISGGDVIR